ncbi:MAG TPA: adenylyl-sulfate kinase [Myxococcales bacterium]|nr:adenylyl-sulfate kinase [Myxococcales bacterium]
MPRTASIRARRKRSSDGRGLVVWVTGRPSSGKSTFARRLDARLREAGRPSVILDGDAVRDALVPHPGFAPASRGRFYETLAALAALIARQGLVVIVAATSGRAIYRERARRLAPRFLLVYLDVALEHCAARDPKGLYARARAGTVSHLPGVGDVYEPPTQAEVRARGGRDARALAEAAALALA